MDPSVDLCVTMNTNDTTDIPYASLISSINYCAISTRHDISYTTNNCTQFTLQPTLVHWEAAKCIVRYLLHTKEYGIIYTGN